MEYTIPGDPTTLTTTMKSRQKAYQHFINNYEEIYAFNKPILKAVNQCYGDKIRELKKNRMDLYSINHRKIFKKVESHFSIIPLWEYLSLIKKPTIEGEDYPDYSIFVNLIKQLIVILQYQIKKKKKMGKEYQDNIQIYPLIEINYLKEKNYSKEQYLEKINTYRDYMNVYTFECLEVNDVFCFISPTPMNEDENFSEVSYNDMSEYFETEFEEKIKQKEFNFNDLEKIIDDHVPSEIKTFITNIREASKINIEKDKIMSEILECINMEKQYKLEKLNFTWKIDKTFLLEYYLLIQISRMLYVVLIFVYENNIIEKNDLKATFEEMSKNTKKIKEIIDKLKKDSEMKKPEKIGKKTIHEFINKTNENYILLLFLIGQPDFINRLLLLDEPIRNLLKLEDLNSETTPLNLFYLFISKIQGDIDECELHNNFVSTNFLKSESQLVNYGKLFLEDLDTVEKIAKDFFQNILLGLFNPNTFKILDQGSQNEKKIYMVEIKKIFIKYESSVYRNTYLDAKDLLLIMEYCKKPASLLIKIKLMDLTMTIENGDELIHLIQEVNNNFPLINVDIDEAKKVFIKINIPFLGSSSGFFANVIIAIDSLMILATKIYINCIRTIFYYKSTKDDIFKYPLFGVMMKEVVDVHKKEIKYNCPKLKKWN